jgi:phospholipid transport system substrate-binding protein
MAVNTLPRVASNQSSKASAPYLRDRTEPVPTTIVSLEIMMPSYVRSFAVLMLGLTAAGQGPSVVAAQSAKSTTAAPNATTFLKGKHEQISKVLKAPGKSSADAAKRSAALNQLLGGLFNYPELAKRSLDTHWKARSEAQRQEFVGLLKQLIQRNYERNLTRTLQYKIRYVGEAPTADGVSVQTLARATNKGRAEPVSIDYAVHKTAGGWQVYDVTTDGVSLGRNYRNQFNRIIKKDGWDALMKRMRAKIASGEDSL